MALVFNRNSFFKLGSGVCRDDCSDLVRRKVSLEPMAIRGYPPVGSSSVWHFLVVDKKQGETDSNS
jgi:hypothetical protein